MRIAPALPEQRRPRLKALLGEGRVVRVLECHDPLSAVLGERATGSGDMRFDALWLSGFSHATSLALPDAEFSVLERRLGATADIAARTRLPLLADADTGGDAAAFTLLCQRLELLGVSGVVVEDKTPGAKRSSLAGGVSHALEEPERFIAKIAAAKQRQLSPDFLVFARTESLIAGFGVDEAVRRAGIYLRSAADGIVIHSKDTTAADLFEFLERYGALQKESGIRKPLACIPTAYAHVTAAELHARGVALVIFGNHMVRAAYKAMQSVASSILATDRTLEANAACTPVADIFEALGAGEMS
jgi:phosphoenolpyruvate phosphomutase